MKRTLLAVTLAVAFSGAAQAAPNFSVSDTFENTASWFTYDFVVTSDGAANGATLFTDSYKAGNFDPVLFVWNADGFLVGWNDNINTLGNMDAFVGFTGDSDFGKLTEGTYSFTILNAPSTFGEYGYVPEVGVTKYDEAAFWFAPGSGVMPSGYGRDFHVGGTGIAAVPEPETWAMLLAGLGVMGAVARRRQK